MRVLSSSILLLISTSKFTVLSFSLPPSFHLPPHPIVHQILLILPPKYILDLSSTLKSFSHSHYHGSIPIVSTYSLYCTCHGNKRRGVSQSADSKHGSSTYSVTLGELCNISELSNFFCKMRLKTELLRTLGELKHGKHISMSVT